jgi:hypothetical protein
MEIATLKTDNLQLQKQKEDMFAMIEQVAVAQEQEEMLQAVCMCVFVLTIFITSVFECLCCDTVNYRKNMLN